MFAGFVKGGGRFDVGGLAIDGGNELWLFLLGGNPLVTRNLKKIVNKAYYLVSSFVTIKNTWFYKCL